MSLNSPPNYSHSENLSVDLSKGKLSNLNVLSGGCDFGAANAARSNLSRTKSNFSTGQKKYTPDRRKSLFVKKIASKSGYILEEDIT